MLSHHIFGIVVSSKSEMIYIILVKTCLKTPTEFILVVIMV